MSKNQDLGELINGVKALATNQLNAPAYTSATSFTGTIAGYLGFDSTGNILTTGASSQWITSGSNIYYNTGFVGIGNNNPTELLVLQRATYPILKFIEGNSNIQGALGYDSGNNYFILNAQSNVPLAFGTNDIVRMRISSAGLIGIGTNNPLAILQVTSASTTSSQPTLMLTQYDSVGGAYANIAGANDAAHGIILRGYPTSGSTTNYSVSAGDYMSFYEYGGEFRFYRKDGTLTELMRLANGNLGIGTNNPSYKLDVAGDVNISGTYRVNGTPIGTGGGGVSGSGSTNFLSKWSASTALTNSQIFDNGSSIGLRTASPFYVIDYQLTGSLRLGYFIGSIDGTDNASGIVAHNGNGITQTVPFGFAGSKFAWYIGTNEAMRIDTNRNLLINTTGGVTGGGALQVNGDVNVTGTFRVNGVQYSTGGGGGIGGGGTIGYIPKFTGGSSIGNSAMYDDGNFSVFVGMTGFVGRSGMPARAVAIYGPESSGFIMKGNTTNGLDTSFITRSEGSGNLWISDNREIFIEANFNSSYIKINGSGVGINTAPFGTPYIFTLPNNYLQAAIAYSWYTYSDGRVKREINDIEYGLNEVMKMKPVKYKHYSSVFEKNTFNLGNEYTNEIGFVAQDMDKIVKEAVNRGSDTELWSLDKSKLIPVLVKAVQELKAELDQLKENNA